MAMNRRMWVELMLLRFQTSLCKLCISLIMNLYLLKNYNDNGNIPFDLIPNNEFNNGHVSYLNRVYENMLLWPNSNGIQRN